MANARYGEWLTEDGLMMIEAWAREGLTEEQIAMKMGISVRTLGKWKLAHGQILQALKKGKAPVDAKVENALLRRALGYSYEEITEELRKDAETGESALVITKKVTKHVPPDTTAQIYWLKNRRPDKWRDKPAEAAGNEDNTIRVVFDPFDGGDANGD